MSNKWDHLVEAENLSKRERENRSKKMVAKETADNLTKAAEEKLQKMAIALAKKRHNQRKLSIGKDMSKNMRISTVLSRLLSRDYSITQAAREANVTREELLAYIKKHKISREPS